MSKIKSLLGESLFWKLKRIKERILKAVVKAVNVIFRVNLFPAYNYYSPLPLISSIEKNKARWMIPSGLAGINYDLPKMEHLLTELIKKHIDEYLQLIPFNKARNLGFGPGFTYVDSITTFAMIRHLKPSKYYEVGSGLSTFYAAEALKRNHDEGNVKSEVICIEPYPYKKLDEIPGISIIAKEVQDVPLQTFLALKEGDVLFLDSSHVLRVDGDIAFLYLEVLPRLEKGVYIHIHDIPFPFNIPYPAEHWVLERAFPMWWTEAMLLQAFLSFNDSFEIILSTPMIRYNNEVMLKGLIPDYKGIKDEPNTFSSIWLKKVK